MTVLPAETIIRGNPPSSSHQVDPLELVAWMENIEGKASLQDTAFQPFLIGQINKYGMATQLYNLTKQGTGSGNVIQSACIDPNTGELFTLHVTGDPSNAVINKFWKHAGQVQTSTRWNSTPTSDIGHQSLSLQYTETAATRFWCTANEAETDYEYKAVRIGIEDGSGTELTFTGKRVYQLFENTLTAHTPHCTVCVDRTGRWLVAELQTDNSTQRIRWFDLQMLADGGAGDYSSMWDSEIVVTDLIDSNAGLPLQGMLADGNGLMIVAGDADVSTTLRMGIYSRSGDAIYRDDDFNIGVDEALGDGAGNQHEIEGLLWFPTGPGMAVPAVCVASGDSGNRTNRIWGLGMDVENHMIGVQGRPALVLRGQLSFEEADAIEIGTYDGPTRMHTDYIKIDPTTPANSFVDLGHGSARRLEGDNFYPIATSLTLEVADDPSAGTTSPTVPTAQATRIGDVVTISIQVDNVDTSGLSGNLYIRGLPSWATPSDTQPISFFCSTGGYDPAGTDTAAVTGLVGTNGTVYVLETDDTGNTAIADASQFTDDSADLRFAGSYIVA